MTSGWPMKWPNSARTARVRCSIVVILSGAAHYTLADTLQVMDSEDTLFMLYTSGSTGRPKGIVHTQGGYLTYATCVANR